LSIAVAIESYDRDDDEDSGEKSPRISINLLIQPHPRHESTFSLSSHAFVSPNRIEKRRIGCEKMSPDSRRRKRKERGFGAEQEEGNFV
jgi:hypothetical protein